MNKVEQNSKRALAIAIALFAVLLLGVLFFSSLFFKDFVPKIIIYLQDFQSVLDREIFILFMIIGFLISLFIVTLFVNSRYKTSHLIDQISVELQLKSKALASSNNDLKTQIKIRKEIEDNLNNQKISLEKTKLEMANLLEDLKNEKNKLEEAKVKDEALLESISDGVIATDRDGRVVFINDNAEKMFSWVSNQALNKEWNKDLLFEIKNEDDSDFKEEDDPIKKAINSNSKNLKVCKFVKKDKTVSLVSISVSPVVLAGRNVGAIAMFRDITKEREVDKAKTEFVSLASHQLRTPLSSINWYTEMLLAGDAGPINDEQKSYLEEIYKGNQRMVELVNSLLNASRIELGSLAVEPEPLDFSKIADSVIAELKPTIIQKRLTVEAKYGDNVPIINADSKLVRILFQNLLSNAVKYTPEDGTIKIGFDKQEEFLLIIIADTGYGIPRGQQDKIFNKLFRADNVREKDTDGTGLGLYLVKSIIDNAGGSIHFYSDENKGTIFYIQFPLKGMTKREGVKSLIETKKIGV